MRIAIKFSYDGKKFHGYARQPDLRTVEGELINRMLKRGLHKNIHRKIFR